jgi:hypothetical protein
MFQFIQRVACKELENKASETEDYEKRGYEVLVIMESQVYEE